MEEDRSSLVIELEGNQRVLRGYSEDNQKAISVTYARGADGSRASRAAHEHARRLPSRPPHASCAPSAASAGRRRRAGRGPGSHRAAVGRTRPPDEGGDQRRSEALRGAQRHPKAICGTQHTFSSSVGGKTANGTSVGARALPPSPSPAPALGSPQSGTGRNLRPR